MAETHCPICFAQLETRELAPCYDCGHDPDELRQLAEGEHTYDEVAVLGARAVLCDFCQVDFASSDPTCLGRARGRPLGRDIQRIRAIAEPHATIDKFCPECRRRLAFLRFVVEARAAASENGCTDGS